MKPVAIFRHHVTEGPGYFATYLERRGVPWTLVKIDQGDPVPADPLAYSGIAFMGGPMSANDDLPWIRESIALVRRAADADVPVLGHCLGGQLMAKALGGQVTRNPVKEIGWGAVAVTEDALARRWFGETSSGFDVFHWHGETFSIPPSATRLLSSAHCENQAFALGKHLGMQCHVEMTEQLIRDWCRNWGREVSALAARVASVQTPEEMTANLRARVPALHAIADRVYAEWIKGLRT
jgi:GMP synthase - Glutamine amidotransferase domain